MKRLDKLSRKDHQRLVHDLVAAISLCSSKKEAALFLQDLLTLQEAKTLAKRLRIAKLLLAGLSYMEIQQSLHVSNGTIAKIASWLAERGDGFRAVIKKIPEFTDEEKFVEVSDWDKFKRSHALYFWPELLLEEIIKGANKRQKERITNVLNTLEEKSDLHKRLEKLLRI